MPKPADPRTVIAVTLKGKLSANREIVDTTVDLAGSLADWIDQKAATMPDKDPRRDGYLELAGRLRGR